jgi:hypothetical protein
MQPVRSPGKCHRAMSWLGRHARTAGAVSSPALAAAIDAWWDRNLNLVFGHPLLDRCDAAIIRSQEIGRFGG